MDDDLQRSGPDLRAAGRRLSRRKSLLVIGGTDSLPETADVKLQRMLDYWRTLSPDGRPPGRDRLDPLAIPDLLAHLVLLDVGQNDFRFSLVGDAVAQRYGGRIKGCSLRDLLEGPILAEALEEHTRCVQHQAPVYVRNNIKTLDPQDQKQYQRLLLPLTDREGIVASILGVMHFDA